MGSGEALISKVPQQGLGRYSAKVEFSVVW